MNTTAKKLVALLSVLLMMATPLTAFAVNPFSVDAAESKNVSGEDPKEDFDWVNVTTPAELNTALSNGGNIRLKANITFTEFADTDLTVPEGKHAVLFLNGYTLNYTPSAELVSEGTITVAFKIYGSAIIEGYKINDNSKIITGNGCGGIVSYGKVETAMLTISQSGDSDSAFAVCSNGGETIVYSGIYTAARYAVLLEGGKMTVHNGTFSSAKYTVFSNTCDSAVLRINGGIFNSTATDAIAFRAVATEGTPDLKINFGEFNAALRSTGCTTKIYGGTFNTAVLDGKSTETSFELYGGTFVDNDLSSLVVSGESEWAKPCVNRIGAFVVESTGVSYNTLGEAFAAASTGDTINIVKSGTYKLVYERNAKLVGKVADIMLDATITYYPSGGMDVDISNVTIKSIETLIDPKSPMNDRIGIVGANSETYTNVTFWGARAFYATYIPPNNSPTVTKFNNCTFNQYYNDYAVDIYDARYVVFDGCEFNCIGKALQCYSDATDLKEVFVKNTEFNDYGHIKSDTSAIEVHTQFSSTANATPWIVHINSCEVNGFCAIGSPCENSLWDAINNNFPAKDLLSKSATIYVDDKRVYPTIYDVTLLNADGSEFKKFTDVDYGTKITTEQLSSLPVAPVNYRFVGYFNESGSTMYFDADGNNVRKLDVKGDLTLYPKWASTLKHGITYDLNGGTGSVIDTNKYAEGDPFITKNADGVTKTGYKFQGWSDGFRTYKADTEYLMGASDLTLKAVWSQKAAPSVESDTVTITIQDKNGNAVEGAAVYVDSSEFGTTDSNGQVSGKLTLTNHSLVAKLVSENACVTSDVDFTSSKTATVKFNDYSVRTVVEKSLASDADVAVSDSINALANEMKEEYGASNIELKVVVNNSAEKAEEVREQLEHIKSESNNSECVFFDISVYVNADGTEEKVTNLAGYDNSVMEFKMAFDTTGKNSIQVWHCHINEITGEKEYTQFSLDATKSGDDGTYYIENNVMHIFTSKFSAFAVTSSENGTHKVTFDVAGGSEAVLPQGNLTAGMTFTVPDYTGVKEGFTFGGWSDGKKVYQSGDTITIQNADVKLTAVWKSNEPEEKTMDVSWMAYIIALFAIAEIGAVYYYAFVKRK